MPLKDIPSRLTVVFEPEMGHWVGQSREMDYAAQGNSIEQTMQRFASGLHLTIALCADNRFSKAEPPCPDNLWNEMAGHPGAIFKTLDTTTWTWSDLEEGPQAA